MKTNKFIILQFIVLFIFVSTLNARYVWINFSQNTVATFFYDPGSLKEIDHYKTIWIMANYIKPTRSGEYSVLVKQKFDCKRARYKILKLKSHTLRNGRGPIITNYPKQTDWKMIVAGTPDSALKKIICWK